MSMTVFVIGTITALIGLGVVAWWHRLLDFAMTHLVPVMESLDPMLGNLARQALVWVDDKMVGVRQQVKAAWSRLRERISKMVIEFKRQVDGTWVGDLIVWLLGDSATEIRQTFDVKWDELPEQVRSAYVRAGSASVRVNIRKLRDEELLETEI